MTIQRAYLKVWLDNFTTLERLAKYEAVCIGCCQCSVLIDPSLMECFAGGLHKNLMLERFSQKAGEAISRTTGPITDLFQLICNLHAESKYCSENLNFDLFFYLFYFFYFFIFLMIEKN